MVEMLGVLAVIGVLSITGIAGYNAALRSHRANEVLNAANMLYVMAQAKNQGRGADTNYTEIGTPPSGVTLAYTASTKAITITFNDEKDCTATKKKLGDKATGECPNLTVTLGESASGGNETEVDIYQACLDAGTCVTDSGDPLGGYCTNGKVDYPYCVTDIGGDTDLYECYTGYCDCYIGTYPDCYTSHQACIDAGECNECDEFSEGDCSTETYACSSGYCRCEAYGIYPDCYTSYQACLDAGKCEECNENSAEKCSTETYFCYSGYCYCKAYGRYPDCYTSYQACKDAGNDTGKCTGCDEYSPEGCSTDTYHCSSGFCDCYIGTYPDCYTSYQACVDAGVCKECNGDSGNCSTDTYFCHSGYCYCKNDASYPDCDVAQACINAGTCACSSGYCYCTDDSKNFPNC